MAKATKTKKVSKKKAAVVDNGQRIAVVCGYCGDSKVFKTLAEAVEWIKEDQRGNYHGEDHYQIVAGVEVKVSLNLTFQGLPEGFTA